MQIGVNLIATNKYKQFVHPLIDSIEKYFLINHDITIFLFTDELIDLQAKRTKIIQTLIPPYRFPYATLYRYKIFSENHLLFDQIDYMFYMDVDMKVVAEVGEEILTNHLVAISHPGFHANNGWGSSYCPPNSLAYLPFDERLNYCAGGFQGGKTEVYLNACFLLAQRILEDQHNGVMAEWHDETHWNWLLNSSTQVTTYKKLDPSYCMPEQPYLRELWKINDLEPKIIALNKNHKEIRS